MTVVAPPKREKTGRRTTAAVMGPVAWTALVVAVYLVVAVAAFWTVWSTDPSRITEPGGDQYGTIWFLRWIPFALLHGSNPFFTTYVNHPFGVNALTNTSVPLLGIVGAPVTLVLGPVVAYNVLCTLALAGSATAGYFFARRWVRWRPAAFAGGLLYGFSPYQIAQSSGGHLNLTFVVLPPVILLTLHELVVRQSGSARRSGVALALLVVGQFFVSTEVLASTVVVGLVCTAAVAVEGRRQVADRYRHAAAGMGWAIGVAGVLLAYPVWFALRGPGSINGPIQLVPQGYRADLLGPVVPDRLMRLAPASLARLADHFSSSITENGSYLGITLLATLAVATMVLWRRSPVARVAVVAMGASFVLSLGAGLVVGQQPGGRPSGLPLPERLLASLPLASNAIPARYSLYVALFAGLLLALILDRIHTVVSQRVIARAGRHRPVRGRVRAATFPVLLGVACLVPLAPRVPLSGPAPIDVPPFFTSAAVRHLPAGAAVLVYPYPSSEAPGGELWQALSGMRFTMPGGYFLVPQRPGGSIAYSSTIRYGADTLTARTLESLGTGAPPPRTATLRAAVRAQLHRWGVRSVIDVPVDDPRAASAVAYLTWLVGRPPTPDAGVDAWFQVDLG